MKILHLALGGCLKAPPVAFGLTEDTGGHITYILGAVEALARDRRVTEIEVVTRAFDDARLGSCYARAIEPLGPKAVLRRIWTRRRDYLVKEALSEEIPSVIEALARHIEGAHRHPDVIHAHFADAGRVAMAMKARFGIPFILTPHSLGCDKRETLAGSDPVLEARIAEENAVIAAADAVVGSSRDETERQLMAYSGARAERIHCVPPGVTHLADAAPQAEAEALIDKFLKDPAKPMVLAIARPVRKKNLAGLVDIFGASPRLRDVANLVICAGLRTGLKAGPAEQRGVMADITDAIDRHDLYGSVAIPKRHEQTHVPALYRLAAARGGVFVNPALCEPFGLTLLEAASHGLPVVATCHGGPSDIVAELGNGFVATPRDRQAFATGIESLITDRQTWERAARNGLANVRGMGWPAYASRFLAICADIAGRGIGAMPRRGRLLVSDIDNTLTGSMRAAERFARWHDAQTDHVFAVATGRSIQAARGVLERWGLPEPRHMITSVGSEIYRREIDGRLSYDDGYADHIAEGWEPELIEVVLAKVSGVTPQPEVEQRAFKRSYFVGDARDATRVERALAEARVRARVIHSHGTLLDILPPRAGKGAAVRWLADRLDIGLRDVVVAGDSGNDRDMLESVPHAVVVANASDELDGVTGVYRAKSAHADGVLEGLRVHRPAEGRMTVDTAPMAV